MIFEPEGDISHYHQRLRIIKFCAYLKTHSGGFWWPWVLVAMLTGVVIYYLGYEVVGQAIMLNALILYLIEFPFMITHTLILGQATLKNLAIVQDHIDEVNKMASEKGIDLQLTVNHQYFDYFLFFITVVKA